ncbi:MAG TPA: phosphoenolpyruvate kinase [Elusimicrobia bacterium]|nr:MAG: phosphoenolpyruvate kinase [Elusimicrobia bacterium GWA2_66_18]OGR70352.1 MAG: phosphoenolpyruvate kinase [Elusimicrobia bacterium GWC2_65_9]HAZ07131.1 phosphoenolpyruvate kinase [Elusimicrobiota bacterium]
MKPQTSLDPKTLKTVFSALTRSHAAFLPRGRREEALRRPVHVVYGGAHLFKSDLARKLGELALRSLARYAPDAVSFARAVGLDERLAHKVYDRVADKLKTEPVEDFRIDFEDGYGHRPDAEEDAHAMSAALETARGLEEGALPPFLGLRIKAFTPELRARSVRTLDVFLSALVRQAKGRLPDPFCVTLPKVRHPGQAAALGRILDAFERRKKLAPGTLKVEVMVETPSALLSADGTVPLRAIVDALRGRCVSAHFGAYDYTAGLDIVAAHQRLDHPACGFARRVLQLALADSGVRLSDSAVTTLPVPPHRAATGERLSASQDRENVEAVRRAWRLHYECAVRSLRDGFYQGWDLHPAQLPTRYAAVYAFFLAGLPEATERLRNFVEKASRATRIGVVFDDAATGQGLLNYFLRARACGAITPAETEAAGLTAEGRRAKSG